MTDLEMTKLCAAAIGLKIEHVQRGWCYYIYHPIEAALPIFAAYHPLSNDGQAMALVRKFALPVSPIIDGDLHIGWVVGAITPQNVNQSDDLNRAIVECVAKMQASQSTREESK